MIICFVYFYDQKPNVKLYPAACGDWVFDSIMHEIVLLLFYPFILMSFREMYMLFSSIINKKIAFLLSIAAGIIIWEIPNMLSMDWIYTVPYLHVEIFNLHILIILGWAALIGLPVYIYDHIL